MDRSGLDRLIKTKNQRKKSRKEDLCDFFVWFGYAGGEVRKVTIGSNIKRQRISPNLIQDQLAERLYVTRQTVSSWERGIH